jgi:hypothetical protein
MRVGVSGSLLPRVTGAVRMQLRRRMALLVHRVDGERFAQ